MIKKWSLVGLFALVFQAAQAQNILMFVSHEDTYYSEYIVVKEALEAEGYTVDVRSASTLDFSIYMNPYSGIEDAANSLSGSTYTEFQNQFSALFGSAWDGASNNAIPDFASVTGSILDVADFSNYEGLIVVGGLGSLDYRVDGSYSSQGAGARLISASDVQTAAEKLNTLALEALGAGKPVMAQCHGASIPAFWRIPGTEGLGTGEEAIGYSLLKGGVSTGYPEAATGPMLASLDITHRNSDRVTISSPHETFEDNNAGEGRILTSRDWFPQTVAYAARTFLNVLETYPAVETRSDEVNVLVLHGGALDDSNMPSSCSAGNKSNDVPCNYETDLDNLPADYTHLMELLSGAAANDDFNLNASQLDLFGTLPFNINDAPEILAELENYDVVIFFKHWSNAISDELQNALVSYADNGGGVMALHHGLYNDVNGGQNKDILANQLFGAHAARAGWSATRTTYTVHSTNYGHFISSYLIDYNAAQSSPSAWDTNSLPISANTGFSTTHTFDVYDELYNNMSFTGTVPLGRNTGDITPLFSNDRDVNTITHTTGFTRTIDLDANDQIGRVVYFEIGERKENINSGSRYGQIVRNAVVWAAALDDEPTGPMEQVITFSPAETNFNYGDQEFTLAATASSGLTVMLASSDTEVLEVNGNMVSIVGAGTATLTASQGGNSEYLAAEDVTVPFTISTAELTITADDKSKTYGTENPDLTMTFDGFVYEDNESSISLPEISTSATEFSNVIEGGYEIALAGGSADNYELIFENGTLTIEKAAQQITIEEIEDKLTNDPDFDLNYTVSSGLTAVVEVEGPASYDAGQISLEGLSGIVTVTVSSTGNDNFTETDASVTFSVNDPEKLDQEITFAEVSEKVFGDVFELEATSSSGLGVEFTVVSGPVELAGNEVTVIGAGSATISARQAGNDEFNAAAEVQRTFNIAKADQQITITAIADKLTSDGPFDVEATVSSELELTFSISSGPATIEGNTITLDGASGEVQLVVSQVGNDNYNTAQELITFLVNDPEKLDQEITFAEISEKVFGDVFELEATSSSGLEVEFAIVSGPVELAENEVTVTGAGSATISARQAGNDEFNVAAEVQRTFNIAKADQQITITAIADKLTSDGPFDVEATVSSELELAFSISSGPATIEGNTITLDGVSGEVQLVVSQVGNDNYNSASQETAFTVAEEQTLRVNGDKIISIYPNPVTSTLTINLEETALVSLLSLDGKTLLRERMSFGNLDFSSFESGLYLLEIRLSKEVIREKIFKSN